MALKTDMIDESLLTVLIGPIRSRPELLERLLAGFFEGWKPDGHIGSGELDFGLVAQALRRYIAEAYVLADDGTFLGVRPDVYDRYAKRRESDPVSEPAVYAGREEMLVAAHVFRNDALRDVADLRRLWEGAAGFTLRQRAIAANACGRALLRGKGTAQRGHTRTSSVRHADLEELSVRLFYNHTMGGTSMAVRIDWTGRTVFSASLRERRGRPDHRGCSRDGCPR